MSSSHKSVKSTSKFKNNKTRTAENVKNNVNNQKKPIGIKFGVTNKNNEKSEILQKKTNTEVCDNASEPDLSSPGLCSALHLANEIQAASSGTSRVEDLKLFQQKHLDDVIKQRAVKKTNVPFTKHIFKDLVDLQINDEEILSGRMLAKNVSFHTNKDPVFHLDDFYKPNFSYQVSAKVPDQQFEIEKIDYYNGFELNERLERLKNLVQH